MKTRIIKEVGHPHVDEILLTIVRRPVKDDYIDVIEISFWDDEDLFYSADVSMNNNHNFMERFICDYTMEAAFELVDELR